MPVIFEKNFKEALDKLPKEEKVELDFCKKNEKEYLRLIEEFESTTKDAFSLLVIFESALEGNFSTSLAAGLYFFRNHSGV